jgi:lauroyl/myristoyl acyltransferase
MGIILIETDADEPDEVSELIHKILDVVPEDISEHITNWMWLHNADEEEKVIELMREKVLEAEELS